MMCVRSSVAAVLACAGMAHAQFGVNTVINGDFESGDTFFELPDNWVTFNNSGGEWSAAQNNTPGGTYSLTIPLVPGFNAWQPVEGDRSQIVPVAPLSNGGDVVLSFFYNMPDPVAADVVGAKIDWFDANGSGVGTTGDLLVEDRATVGWEQATFTVTPPGGATTARIFLFTFDGNSADGNNPGAPEGIVYYDDVSLIQMMGTGPCNSADLAEPFGTLDSTDLVELVQNVKADELLLTQNDNRLGNPSFEESVDSDEGIVPAGWFSFNFTPDSDFYPMSGENGAPTARTGNRMIRVGPSGSSFQGWGGTPNAEPELPDTAVDFNLVNEVLFEGWFNIPEAIDEQVVGVKLEFLNESEDGGFGGFVGGYVPEGAPNSDLIISDGSATDGWQKFEFRFDGATFSPVADLVRPLMFLFDGAGVEGNIYFDDIFIGQEDIQVGDYNGDGLTDFRDVIDAARDVDAGCPGA